MRRTQRSAQALLLVGSLSTVAAAQVPVRELGRAAAASAGSSGDPAPLLPAIVELPEGEDTSSPHVAVGATRWRAARASLADLVALAEAHPSWRVTWSAPLHPLLDRSGQWTRAPQFRNETGRTGKGVFVAVIDTGIDPLHPDFRNPDGTSRIAYYVDFSKQPLGKDPDAEKQCPTDVPCLVLPGSELDRMLSTGDIVVGDPSGHGTHVTSLAAGNGGPSGKFVGVAPGASIIAVNAANDSGAIEDATILAATDLVFFLAERDGTKAGGAPVPTVVNLSLGSDFGPHDGTSALERGLAEHVGPTHPGRAIVVAAGNSAGLVSLPTSYPVPLGIHTDVHVTRGSRVRIPILSDASSRAGRTLSANILAWIAFRPEDDVSVGLETRSGTWVSPQPPGTAGEFHRGSALTAKIVNGSTESLDAAAPDSRAAAVLIGGKFAREEVFAITLEGHGTAHLWVQSEGDLNPDSGSLGALFPAATKQSTITIPAANPALIAVGATLNRTDWVDRSGDEIRIDRLGGVNHPPLDSLAFFSSAGPTSDMRFKPDLVAPGAFVAGAMSRQADPASNPISIFADSAFCDPAAECAVLDDDHAVTVGTSMSAPIVSGAVALLFQGDPGLTSDRVLARLQAGARFPSGLVPVASQLGAGALDLEGALDVERLEAHPEGRTPVAGRSWLTLGESFAHPDEEYAVPAFLQLRDSEGRAADGVGPSDLEIDVRRGRLVGMPVLVAPGLVRFAVAAYPATGGETLTVDVSSGGSPVAHASVPIAVDVNVAREGFSARGGCSVGRTRADATWSALGSVVALIGRRGRRCRRAARTARSPDRTDTTDRARRGSSRR